MTDARQLPPHGSREPTPEGDTVFGSAVEGAARRTAAHFAGHNAGEPAEAPDAIELWGRRIGRALSLAGCIGLGIYLFLTYLR